MGTVMILCASVSLAGVGWTEQEPRFVFESAELLPEVVIEGESVKIHTQGLYVTDEAYWVTGRLEKQPKRSLLLKFSRRDVSSYEMIDITPAKIDGDTLDHPGGFDVDENGTLWIPLSTSNPAGPTLVYRLSVEPGQDLASAKREVAFRVDDHIGAICLASDGSLIGANWDTKRVYVWSPEGKLLKRSDRSELFADVPHWQLAVQDWKRVEIDGRGVIMAGGLDRSQDSARATIQLIDVYEGKIHETHRFSSMNNVSRPITNEGLDVHEGELFLLPEDIGRGAKVLRYTIRTRD